MKARRGFTLVELLIVVAIIALLLGILVPALAQAEKQCQCALCMSNLKQLYTGVSYYCQDNRGMIPPFRSSGKPNTVDPSPSNMGWAELIDRYMPCQCVDRTGGQEIYRAVHRCPNKRSNVDEGDASCPIDGSYGLNGYISTFVSWSANKPKAVFDWVQMDTIRTPLVLVAECCRMSVLPTSPPGQQAVIARHRQFTCTNFVWTQGNVEVGLATDLVDHKEWWDQNWYPGKTYANGLPLP